MKNHDEHAELDALLNSEQQQVVRETVRALPEDSLSMAWRSELNEKLLKVRPAPRWRAQVAAKWKPLVGLALAGCLAMAVTLRTSINSSHRTDNLEASLVSVYDEQTNMDEIAGSGLAFNEVSNTTRTSDSSSDWTESDLTNL